jgi:hypothetical protein
MIVSEIRIAVPLALRAKLRARMVFWKLCALFGWQPSEADYDRLARWILDRLRLTVE